MAESWQNLGREFGFRGGIFVSGMLCQADTVTFAGVGLTKKADSLIRGPAFCVEKIMKPARLGAHRACAGWLIPLGFKKILSKEVKFFKQ